MFLLNFFYLIKQFPDVNKISTIKWWTGDGSDWDAPRSRWPRSDRLFFVNIGVNNTLYLPDRPRTHTRRMKNSTCIQDTIFLQRNWLLGSKNVFTFQSHLVSISAHSRTIKKSILPGECSRLLRQNHVFFKRFIRIVSTITPIAADCFEVKWQCTYDTCKFMTRKHDWRSGSDAVSFNTARLP